MEVLLQEILKQFGIENIQSISPLGNGLINTTYKVQANEVYVLQKINTLVFKDAKAIFYNQNVLENYLLENDVAYEIVPACTTKNGNNYFEDAAGDYYRVAPFIKNTHTKNVVQNAAEAYEAACAFGNFTNAFQNIEVEKLKPVIPNFHDIGLRYYQFTTAIKNGNVARILQSKIEIEKLLNHVDIVKKYAEIINHKNWKTRVTHHDTKISNVLFNADNKATHVIDLDTVMPGFFISDVGDMLRTYLSPVSEEENDVEKIIIRKDIYQAIYTGYTDTLKDNFTPEEKGNFGYAGKFMIYMQALRFITDYLNDDIYYGAKYEQHNYVRACNQIYLLEKLISFERINR